MTERRAEITIFTKRGGKLTKHIHLVDGAISNDSSACAMAEGEARRASINVNSIATLATLINGLGPKQAYAIGRLKEGLADHVDIVTADKLADFHGKPNVAARTKECLVFVAGAAAICLLDIDLKGLSEDAEHQIGDDVWKALCDVVPSLATAARVVRCSTSHGLRNRETGDTYPSSGGLHIAIVVADGADIPRFLAALHDRLWLAGLGWGMISAAGSFLERALIDRAVGSPERLIFEAPPVVVPPLVQGPRLAKAFEGDILDTHVACPPLTSAERAEAKRLKEAERFRLKPESAVKRAKWSDVHIKRILATGKPESEARAQVDWWLDSKELSGDFPLPFDDPKLAGTSVADVLADPDKFLDKPLADPFEGPAYGRGKARVYQRANATLFINSFAHGGARYELKAARAPPAGQPKPRKRTQTTMGANMEPELIVWLWPGWLAHGKLHILAGRPGSLKTTAAMDFAATVTTGGQWPDGSSAAIGNVLVWSGEDAVNDTLLPRFMATGGDRARVAFVTGVEEKGKTRSFDPARDLDDLVAVCAEIGEVNLIIIDPVVAVAKGDSHKNAEARRDLQPLVDLAEKTQAAVLGIHHLTKRTEGADPVDRVSGSLAFGAGPRVVLLNALDGKGATETRGLLMRAKNNIGPAHGGFEFTADTRPLDGYPHISAQRILWGAAVTDSARDILERLEGKAAKVEMSKRKVNAFLLGALQGRGERLAAEVIAEGEAAGFSERALRRAFKAMGGQSEKASMKTGWLWTLPEGEAASNVVPFPGGWDGDDALFDPNG